MTNEQIKATELADEQLKAVSGGVSQNSNGTYTFREGDTLKHGMEAFIVTKDYLNVSANTLIEVRAATNSRLSTFEAWDLYDMWLHADSGSTEITK